MDADVRRQLLELYAQVCRALSDPKRLLIIEALRNGPKTVGELADGLSLSQPNVSQHLAVLRERRIVTADREGTRVRYRLHGDRVLAALDLLREHAHDTVREEVRVVESFPHP
jgi:DNA-binding transcriptional ArsR family regulator